MTRNSLSSALALLLVFPWAQSPGQSRQTNSWQQLRAPNGGIALSLGTRPDGQIIAGTFGGGIFLSVDQGDTWESTNKGLTDLDVFAVVVDPEGRAFAGTFGGGIYRLGYNDTEWTPVNEGLSSREILSLSVTPGGHLLAGTSEDGVFFSNNGGSYWWPVGLRGHFVTSVAANRVGYLFAATTEGIHRSINNGRSWVRVDEGMESNDIRVIALNEEEQIFAATNGGGMYRSTDNGNSWKRLPRGLTNHSIGSVAFGPAGVIYCGTAVGIFSSSDNGEHWSRLNTGLPNISVRSLAITSLGYIFAGTTAGGIFRGSLNRISSRSEIGGDSFLGSIIYHGTQKSSP